MKLRLAKRVSRLSYPGIVVADFEVRALAIEDLLCPVRPVPAFADGVKGSLEEEGLRHPVIVVRMPREDLIAYYESRGMTARYVPDRPWINCVCGGTNRVHAAKELGYTHVDCLLVPDFDVALRIQAQQRSTYERARA